MTNCVNYIKNKLQDYINKKIGDVLQILHPLSYQAIVQVVSFITGLG